MFFNVKLYIFSVSFNFGVFNGGLNIRVSFGDYDFDFFVRNIVECSSNWCFVYCCDRFSLLNI